MAALCRRTASPTTAARRRRPLRRPLPSTGFRRVADTPLAFPLRTVHSDPRRDTIPRGNTIMTTTKFGLAQPARRVEVPSLLRGDGRYTDDIILPGMLFGVVLPSPHAAASITRLDSSEAV